MLSREACAEGGGRVYGFLVNIVRCRILIAPGDLDPRPKGSLADLHSLVLIDFLADEIDEFFG